MLTVLDVPARQKAKAPRTTTNPLRRMYFVEHREAKGLDAVDIVKRSGMHKSVVSRLESNDRPAKPDQIRKYASAVGVSPGALFHPPDRLGVDDMVAALPDDLREKVIGIIANLAKGQR